MGWSDAFTITRRTFTSPVVAREPPPVTTESGSHFDQRQWTTNDELVSVRSWISAFLSSSPAERKGTTTNPLLKLFNVFFKCWMAWHRMWRKVRPIQLTRGLFLILVTVEEKTELTFPSRSQFLIRVVSVWPSLVVPAVPSAARRRNTIVSMIVVFACIPTNQILVH